jgi:dihydrolipoamide dehydrogenase
MDKPPRNVAPSNGPTVEATTSAETLIRQIQSLLPQEEPLSMADSNFDTDLIVIGAGPGGYVAAIQAAQLGLKVICVEKEFLGGTCLNWGCIPSKAWIASVEALDKIKHAETMGIEVKGEVKADFDAIKARVEKIVKTQRGGVGMLFKKNGIEHVEGFASFVDKNTIEVEKDDKKKKLTAKNFIIAGGSSVIHLPIEGLGKSAKEGVWTSDDAVFAPTLPKSMVIVGGGAVGVEFAYVFSGLGVKTTVVEMMPSLIPMFDGDLGAELGRSFKKRGVDVMLGATVEKAAKTKTGWKCSVKAGNEKKEIEAEVVLLGVGRKANTDGMNLEKIGVKLHKRGIEVANDKMQTAVPNVYAIGDVIGHIQLAHVASMEGVVAAMNCAGKERAMDYKVVPNCVYTIPEVATVGLTEGEAKTQGYDVTVGKFNFRANGKAMAAGEQDGFVKIVAEKKYGEVLGMSIVGPHATDLIHVGATAIQLEATLDYMTSMIHAHPTLAEVILEAYETAAHGKSIHTL